MSRSTHPHDRRRARGGDREPARSRRVEVTQAHLDRIAAVDGAVHAFLHVAGGQARRAGPGGRRPAGGRASALGPLAGVPLALKDVFTTTGMPTTCGSKILEGWRPAVRRDHRPRRLREAGVVILGKTNMDEFAMGSSTENSAYGPTHNPWDLARIPGGSSGGSSAAVAAYEAPLAIGTDTGGSIRQPAAVSGIVGTKPTYGGSSRYGVVAFASSLDTPGPFGPHRARRGAAARGDRPATTRCDSTSIDAPVPPVVEPRPGEADVSGLRIGVVKRARRRGLPAGRAGPVRRGGGAAGVAGRQGRRGLLPALRVRAARLLPDRAQRVLVQPGPVRRDAVRPAGRRRRHPRAPRRSWR